MARYCRERQHSPRRYDKKSFRTIRRGKHGVKQIVACRKKKYNRRKRKCKESMQVQSILYPEGSDPRCPRGAGGRELKRAKRHKKNPHLVSGKWRYMGMFEKQDIPEVRRMLRIHGLANKITKDHVRHDPKYREVYITREKFDVAYRAITRLFEGGRAA